MKISPGGSLGHGHKSKRVREQCCSITTTSECKKYNFKLQELRSEYNDKISFIDPCHLPTIWSKKAKATTKATLRATNWLNLRQKRLLRTKTKEELLANLTKSRSSYHKQQLHRNQHQAIISFFLHFRNIFFQFFQEFLKYLAFSF